MTKSDIVAILKANKGYINFPNPLELKGPKEEITSISLHVGMDAWSGEQGEQVTVYHANGASNLDWCESEVIETISEHLKNMNL